MFFSFFLVIEKSASNIPDYDDTPLQGNIWEESDPDVC